MPTFNYKVIRVDVVRRAEIALAMLVELDRAQEYVVDPVIEIR